MLAACTIPSNPIHMEGAPKGAESAKRSSGASWSCSHLACRFAWQQPLDSQLNTFVQQLEEIEPILKLRLGTIMLILGGGGVRGCLLPQRRQIAAALTEHAHRIWRQ